MQLKTISILLILLCVLSARTRGNYASYMSKADKVKELILQKNYNKLYKERPSWINKNQSKAIFKKEMKSIIEDSIKIGSLKLTKFDKLDKTSTLRFYYQDTTTNKYYAITIDNIGKRYDFIKFEIINLNNGSNKRFNADSGS
jgi:hypothetical protein